MNQTRILYAISLGCQVREAGVAGVLGSAPGAYLIGSLKAAKPPPKGSGKMAFFFSE